MNEGKLLKQLYSSDPHVEKLIKDTVNAWPYGYCEYIKLSQSQQRDDNWLIEVSAQNDEESTKCLIEAYMHLSCGFSLICCDSEDMKSWIGDCNIFRTIKVGSVSSDAVSEVQDRLTETINYFEKNGLSVFGVLLTVIGRMISLEDFALYASSVEKLGVSSCFNTCLFDDDNKNTDLLVHLALKPKSQEYLTK
jgi:hypothetical protein